MAQIDSSLTRPQSIEGRVFEMRTPQERLEALQTAFDYRGDVTLRFNDGNQVEGFLYKFDEKKGTVDLFVKSGKTSDSASFEVSNIQAIILSGADPAFGKSWEDWMNKNTSDRKSEEEQLKRQSENLGLL